MEDLTGKTLGRFEISSLIGRGGMATVYKAIDPGLNRTVAIKLLLPHLSADPSFVARFRREARAVAALRHPNIVQVHELDSADGWLFMVMEYVDGPTLATYLKRLAGKGLRPSREDILRIFLPLCSAVDYANMEGMVHRDIKPANIILTHSGEPVITEYGIARIAGATSYTMPGTVVGSAQYMSPEQAQGLAADNRSDIYSLGICLFEALTGRVPFDGDTTGSILVQQITAPVPSARTLNPELPPGVEAVLARVLAKKSDDRYQLAADLANDLEAALAAPSGAKATDTWSAPTGAAAGAGAAVGAGADAAASAPAGFPGASWVGGPAASPAGTAGQQAFAPAPPPVHAPAPLVTWPPGSPGPPAPPVGPAPPRRSRRRPVLVALLALLVVGAGLGAAFLLTFGGAGTSSSSSTPLASTSVTSTTSGNSATSRSSTTSGNSTTSGSAGQLVDLSPRASLTASSVRASESTVSYRPDLVLDNDPTTCWTEGVAGYGEGESILFTFSKTVTVSQVRIIPGLDKVKSGWDRWWSNGRVHTFRLEFADGTSEEHSVNDAREMQAVPLDARRETTSVCFVIVSVYPAHSVPHQADDTCVAELHLWGTR